MSVTFLARDLIFLSREGRDLGVAFQAPPGSQASSRGEATSKVTLKILQARLQQYMNRELPDVQAGFTKGRAAEASRQGLGSGLRLELQKYTPVP